MAKYIIDIPDEYEKRYAQTNCETLYIPMQVGTRNYNVWIGTGLRVTPYTEPDRKAIDLQHAHDIENVAKMNYNEGAKDAWEFVVKCLKMDGSDFYESFGSCDALYLTNLSYQEAKAKYDEWRKQKEEIRIGDEVEYECDGIVRFVVTGFCGETAFGFKHQCDYDDVGEYCDIEDLRKTGRHFPEVAELLKKIRGEGQ